MRRHFGVPGRYDFLMAHIGLRWIHANSEENGIKAKVSYPFSIKY